MKNKRPKYNKYKNYYKIKIRTKKTEDKKKEINDIK